MTWTFTFTLNNATPSLNEIHGKHWGSNVRNKTATMWFLTAALLRSPHVPRAAGKRILTIERHGRGRLDHDNLVGGVKWLVDAIKDRGLIRDDSEEWMDLRVSQIVRRDVSPHTVVTLEDLP